METYYVQTSVSAYGSNVGYNMGLDWAGINAATSQTEEEAAANPNWRTKAKNALDGIPGIKELNALFGRKEVDKNYG